MMPIVCGNPRRRPSGGRLAATVVVSSLLALAMGGSAAAGASKTITVDCSKGESINQALADKSEELIVEVEGLCHEKVVVRRSGVTLRGSDPALDGIVGPASGPAGEPLISVWGAEVSGSFFVVEEAQFAVEIHDLGLRGNDGAGLAVWGSLVQAKNVSITDNGGVGVHASGASGIHLIDAVVSNNADTGINATRSSFMLCEGCTVEENGGDGVRGVNGAQVILFESAVTDNEGIGVRALTSANATVDSSVIAGEFAVGGAARARVTGFNTTVTATELSFWFTGADVQWSDSSFEGSMRINKDAYARLIGCTQTSNPGENFIAEDSTLDLAGGTLVGTTRLVRFATGSLLGGAALGDLVCETGSDAACDGSETKSSSSCSLCP